MLSALSEERNAQKVSSLCLRSNKNYCLGSDLEACSASDRIDAANQIPVMAAILVWRGSHEFMYFTGIHNHPSAHFCACRFRSCDDTQESIFFQKWALSRSHAVLLMKTTKVQISWVSSHDPYWENKIDKRKRSIAVTSGNMVYID